MEKRYDSYDQFFGEVFAEPDKQAPVPFAYQRQLAEAAELPALVNVPTGAGKTKAILGAWLWRRLTKPESAGRRLVYCLPMRTLVEQTRDVARAAIKQLVEQGVVEQGRFRVHVLMGGDVTDEWDGWPELELGWSRGVLRRAGHRMPIIMLTGAQGEADTILGLDSGANDYVTKPFKLGVLLARIRAQLRTHEQSDDATFVIGPYSFRPGQKLLVHGDSGKKVRLTEKETSILKFLLRAGDKAVGRDVLLDQVWGYNAGVTTHTLETHIYRLRQKIEKDPRKEATILVTDQGGYRLVP